MDEDDFRRMQSLLQEVDEHRETVKKLEAAVKHAVDVAAAERRARERAEDSARRAWAIAAGS